jgi:hypothetical protein
VALLSGNTPISCLYYQGETPIRRQNTRTMTGRQVGNQIHQSLQWDTKYKQNTSFTKKIPTDFYQGYQENVKAALCSFFIFVLVTIVVVCLIYLYICCLLHILARQTNIDTGRLQLGRNYLPPGLDTGEVLNSYDCITKHKKSEIGENKK